MPARWGCGISLPPRGRWHLRSKWRRGRGAVWKGLAQPRNSPSWVRAPTARPSECRQDGDAGLASPLGGGGICEANGGEGLRGMDTLIRECLAVSLGLLSRRFPFPSKQNSTLFRFRPTSPIGLTKQFCPAAENLGRLSERFLPEWVEFPKGRALERARQNLF